MFWAIILPMFIILPNAIAWVNENRRIEEEILRSYDRRHRPVKKESTATQVQLFFTINHIEKVDQMEGTMLLHGILWASWYDEYLKWSPSQHNHTFFISLETWKIWQPTFALYNSARSNNWFIYMNGVPATVSNDGKIYAAGTFTFQVTCQFDFSNFPYDVQECPIVLADWIYDLSKVNLSGVATRAGSIGAMSKPAIRLSFDPLSENAKRHVAGWEIIDTWQRQCYWGPTGYCIDQSPVGPLDNYWSLFEFGVKIKRHAPYYGLTLVSPTFIATILMLLIFWLENLSLAITLCAINLLMESFSGWTLAKQMPPGDGVIPTIGIVHIWIVSLTLLAFAFHCVLHFLLSILPPDIKFLPENLTNITSLLREYKFFKAEGLSFDPQTMMGYSSLIENHVGENRGEGVLFEFDQEQSPVMPHQYDSMIIEMEPVESSTSTTQHQQQQQFQPIQLGEQSNSQGTSSSSNNQEQPSTSSTAAHKKSFSLNFSLFGSDQKKSPSVISGPFATVSGLFDAKQKTASMEERMNNNEHDDDDARLLLIEDGDDESSSKRSSNEKEASSTAATGRIVDVGTSAEAPRATDDRSLKFADRKPSKERSALEREFCVLRRLVFAAFLLASIILLSFLIF